MPKYEQRGGVEVRAQSLRLYFQMDGEAIKEPLDLPPTEENIEYARGLVAVIKMEIKAGRYDHAKYFPKSKRIKENLFERWIELYLLDKKDDVSPVSYKTYQRRIDKHIRPFFADKSPKEITHEVLLRWKKQHLVQVGNRTQREILCNMKAILRLCLINEQIEKNPAEYLEVGDAEPPTPHPYTLDEIAAIEATETSNSDGLSLVLWLIWTGARISEGITARWEDIDLETGIWNVSLACVDGVYKVPKTRKSTRIVELMPQALAILKRQEYRRCSDSTRYIQVLQRDNRSYKKQAFTPLFINANTGKPWIDSRRFNDGFWVTHLAKAGIKHRGANQARHTWISLMLTYGMPLHWIIEQVGHTDASMIHKHYGKLLKRRDGARLADEAARRIASDKRS